MAKPTRQQRNDQPPNKGLKPLVLTFILAHLAFFAVRLYYLNMSDTHEVIRAFLESQSTLALATVNATGQAEVAPLFYLSDEALNLYWLSSETSRHSMNLSARPRVSATVYPGVWNWNDIRGVQTEGEAQAVRDEFVRERVLQRYLAKFLLPSSFDSIIATTTLYVLKPQWIRWLDNGVSFGYKTEIDL